MRSPDLVDLGTERLAGMLLKEVQVVIVLTSKTAGIGRIPMQTALAFAQVVVDHNSRTDCLPGMTDT
jgi:hypothetical protein